MKSFILSFLVACVSVTAFSQNQYTIIPEPQKLIPATGVYSFKSNTAITVIAKDNDITSVAKMLAEQLKASFDIALPVKAGSLKSNGIFFVQNDQLGDEAYQLNITTKNITIQSKNGKGAFYALQSLFQLMPAQVYTAVKSNIIATVPACQVADAPRFSYRGLMLDAGRHFYSVDFIKRYIDLMAVYKLNTFHWHLTEDQGWRIEIKKYPKLTTVGGFRNANIIGRYPGKGSNNTRYGGYYTQAQIKEIVKYAADRFVTIIPEIEMPGHASAAIAAYPELSCFPNESTPAIPTMHSAATLEALKKPGTKIVQETWGVFDDVFVPSDNTFTFLQNVLDEVMALFPSTYIHIGGDECPKESWKRSEFCQKLIKEKGLKDEHGLQSYFIGRIEKYLNSKGRQIIGWDEILEGGLAPNATVMSWRGEKGGIEAAKEKHTVIMTPGGWMYFDHQQNKKEDSVTIGGYTTIQKVYSYEPLPKEMDPADHKYVLGAQANVWTEYMNNTAKAEYMVFPRMSALSEVLWTSKENKSWPAFEKKLLHEFKRYDNFKINYSKAYFNPENN